MNEIGKKIKEATEVLKSISYFIQRNAASIFRLQGHPWPGV